jgi:hypothetical protein
LLTPLPEQPAENASDLIFTADEPGAPPTPRSAVARPIRPSTNDVLAQLASHPPAAAAEPEPEPPVDPAERDAAMDQILREILADPASGGRPVAVLYQDFTVRCRMRRVGGGAPSLPEFRRRLAAARAGASQEIRDSAEWGRALACAADLPDDIQGLFLFMACAAIARAPCPTDSQLAEAYGTHSPGRVRRLLAYLEEQGVLVCHTDFGGLRTLGFPTLGVETAPGAPKAAPEAVLDALAQ